MVQLEFEVDPRCQRSPLRRSARSFGTDRPDLRIARAGDSTDSVADSTTVAGPVHRPEPAHRRTGDSAADDGAAPSGAGMGELAARSIARARPRGRWAGRCLYRPRGVPQAHLLCACCPMPIPLAQGQCRTSPNSSTNRQHVYMVNGCDRTRTMREASTIPDWKRRREHARASRRTQRDDRCYTVIAPSLDLAISDAFIFSPLQTLP